MTIYITCIKLSTCYVIYQQHW